MGCFSRLPLTNSLQSLRFIQSAPLSSSSFSSTPTTTPTFTLNVVFQFLSEEFGLSSSQVATVLKRRPELLTSKSDHTARDAINVLRNSGFTENQLKNTIVRNPAILSLNVDRQLKPKMEFLKNLGLAPEVIPIIISRSPRLLSTSLENSLASKILDLRSLFGSKDDLCKALRWTPDILLSDFKKQVTPKVEYVKNSLGIREGTTAFVRALCAVLCVRFETIEQKTKNLASHGLAGEEIRLILQRHPGVLRHSTKKIKETMDFLTITAGLMPGIVASYPRTLGYSVEKRLKPRFEFFQYLRTNPQCKCRVSLIKFMELSEKRFLKYFSQYSTQSSLTIIQPPKTSILEQ